MSFLSSIPKRFPLGFAVAYGATKTVGADLAVQKLVERREWSQINQMRAAVFFAFGGFQVGFVQYMVYCSVYSRLFPSAGDFAAKTFQQKMKDMAGIGNVFKQVAIDQFVYHPLCYFPVFYVCKELAAKDRKSGKPRRDPGTVVSGALTKYYGNLQADLTALWTLWIPVSTWNFMFTPMHLRVPFVATVGIVWCMYLSFARGNPRLTPAAEKLKSQLGKLTEELLQEQLQAVYNQHMRVSAHKKGLDRAAFGEMMAQFGLSDVDHDGRAKATLDSLFEAFDLKNDGYVDSEELATGMAMLLGRGTPQQRMRFIFEALDVRHDGKVTEGECTEVVRSLLWAREALVRFPSDVFDNCNHMVGMAKREHSDEYPVQADTPEWQEQRLQYIWARKPGWYGKPLDEMIQLEASEVTRGIMEDIGGMDKVFNLKDFEKWGESNQDSADLIRLFNLMHTDKMEM